MVLPQKGWNAYPLFFVLLDSVKTVIAAVRSPVNDTTLRSVAYSLQDGCLAGICTSYNEDSETRLTVRLCKDRRFVSHVSWG